MLTKTLFERLYHASSIVAITGNGIVNESGLATFNSPESTFEGHRLSDIASLKTLHSDPELLWRWCLQRRDEVNSSRPNLGHYALVDLEQRFSDFHLITLCTDGLHIDAGSEKLIEAHGNIFGVRCTACDFHAGVYEVTSSKPECPQCGELLRPGIWLEGEDISSILREQIYDVAPQCEVLFVIGTSLHAEPAKSVPFLAKANGSYVVEINPEDTGISAKANEKVSGRASDWLPKISIVFDQITGKS
jgi:NAD-dependent deacetylase